MAKRSRPPALEDERPFHNPFGGLKGRAAEPPGGSAAPPVRPAPAETKGPGRAVVRYERKGHGGKEMTRVEQLGLGRAELERWLKELKQALGCGGVLEGDSLLVQGDQRERVKTWLERRGVKKVVVS